MENNIYAHTREAVRVKVKKCEINIAPEWRKFSVDPQITTLEVLYSLLAKAFDIKSDFSIKYKAFDPAGNEIYLAVLSDWDLDAAFLRIHNISIQTATEPCLTLQIDIKPFTEVKEWDPDGPSTSGISPSSSGNLNATREIISPLQQSFGVSQKYVQHMQTKLPGLIMNQMEKTFSIVQKAFNLTEETISSLPPRPPLSDNEFRLFLDAVGQIQRSDELRKVIFFGGIDSSLRRVVWKHILNVYPHGMNGHQRMDYMRRKAEHYYKLRDTWKFAIKQGELSYVTSMVKKDVLRTDRLHPFYAGSDDNQNIAALFNILTTYALNHPSVSYCQGMSDIASPLLVTMNDEAQAYICFCAIMSRVKGNFMLDGIAMTQKFAHLTEALGFYDPEFWEYLKSQQADDLLFCYRWLLLELKREFPFDDSLRMLEVQWSSLKYETCAGKELSLYEKEFVPILETSAPTTSSSHSSSFGGAPISPSYFIGKPRENPYTKICALRRQSSTASLTSLSSSLSTSASKLDTTRRLNQSLDDNITRRTVRRQRNASAKAHQSLDETKMLMLIEGMDSCDDKSNEIFIENESTQKVDDDDNDDDVFITSKTTTPSPTTKATASTTASNEIIHFNFHPTNPFIEDATKNVKQLSPQRSVPESQESQSNKRCEQSSARHAGVTKLHNTNILSNYNTVSNIIAKQLANASNMGESVKRVGSGSGGHFRELKEKIAATSRKAALSFDDASTSMNNNEKSQQKLVKNFNEFLNFASVNKNRIADKFATPNTAIGTPLKTYDKNMTKSPSPTNAQQEHITTSSLHPLVQFTKSGCVSSLDESDSSSVPDTTWSGSTAATAIQQTNNLSSNSLQLELNSLSSAAHTPERTPTLERKLPDVDKESSYVVSLPTRNLTNETVLTPDDSQDQDQDQEYYPMTTAITRELRLEADNLDRQVFGEFKNDALDANMRTNCDIEYEKLDKDSLDLVDLDLKENEIVRCPDISELLLRRRNRETKAHKKSNVSRTDNWEEQQLGLNLITNIQIDNNLNINTEVGTTTATAPSSAPIALTTTTTTINEHKLNPFIDENLLHENDTTTPSARLANSNSLPEVGMSASSGIADASAAMIEMATNASDEIVFAKSPLPKAANSNSNSSCLSTTSSTPMLPPPSEFGGGNPFLMFLCLTLLLQHRNTIIKSSMDYNEIAMHFDKMVRKHDVTRVLNQARRMYIEYLKVQNAHSQRLQAPSYDVANGDINKNSNTTSIEPLHHQQRKRQQQMHT